MKKTIITYLITLAFPLIVSGCASPPTVYLYGKYLEPSKVQALSEQLTDQGLNVEINILPTGVNTSFNDHAMFDYVSGIVVGDSGVILFTDRAGENEDIGFQIPDYNNFGEFVEYADDMLLSGFIATVKIVVFGILLGFTIGVLLAMLKTAPTSFLSRFCFDLFFI